MPPVSLPALALLSPSPLAGLVLGVFLPALALALLLLSWPASLLGLALGALLPVLALVLLLQLWPASRLAHSPLYKRSKLLATWGYIRLRGVWLSAVKATQQALHCALNKSGCNLATTQACLCRHAVKNCT